MSTFLVTTDSRHVVFYTGAGVWVYDKETGKVEFKPEMPILERSLAAVAELLRSTEGVREADETRLHAIKLAATLAERATKEAVATKPVKHAA